MTETQTEFLERQVISLTKENHLLKEDILAFQHFLNNRVKELKSFLREIPGRYLNMELCDITQLLSYVKEDFAHYQTFINGQAHEVKQLKNQYSEIRDLLQEQQKLHDQQLSVVEANLTDQYSRALKELQENFIVVNSNSEIYRKSIQTLSQEKQSCDKQIANLQDELQKLKKSYEKEKIELLQAVSRGKQQMTDIEKVYMMRIHKVQQQNFEEYQNKLKMQAKDQTEKDQHITELSNKLSSFEQYNCELKQNYEKLLQSLKEEQERIKQQQLELQNLFNINSQLQEQIKQQELINQQVNEENSKLKKEIDNLQQGKQKQKKIIENQSEMLDQALHELNSIIPQKSDIMKQSSIKTQLMCKIKQIATQYKGTVDENIKVSQQLLKLQDQCIHLQEQQNQLIFQNEMFQQKNSQLQEQMLTQQEFELKYRKIVNQVVYLGQTNPKMLQNIQKQISVDFYKEYKVLNQITENDQNRPLFMLAENQETVEEIQKTVVLEDKSQQYDAIETISQNEKQDSRQIESEKHQPQIKEELPQQLWKNSLKMTLTPILCQQQELTQESFCEHKIDVQTQTFKQKYISKFVPHDNLDEIVEEMKAGFAGFVETNDIETQTNVQQKEDKSVQTGFKVKKTENREKSIKQVQNSQIQSVNAESNIMKQLDSQQGKIVQLNRIIQQLELKLKESLFLNDKLTEDYEIKSRDLTRAGECFRNKLQEQMVEYENKLEAQATLLNSQIDTITKEMKEKDLNYKEQCHQFQHQISTLQKENKIQKEENNQLQANLNNCLKNIQDLQIIIKQNEISHQSEIDKLVQTVEMLQNQFDNRPSLPCDVENIKNLQNENCQLQETISKNFAKIEHANEIVKYLQIEVENYKKQYNLFSNIKPKQLQQKKLAIESTNDEEKSIVYDSKADFLPTVTNREAYSNAKSVSQRKRVYKLSDFEIKQHTTKYFFKQNTPNLNKTQIVPRTSSPTSKNTKYVQNTQRKFNNPFDNDQILHNAELLVENIKAGTPRTKQTQKSNDYFFLKGSIIEQNSTCQSKQKI